MFAKKIPGKPKNFVDRPHLRKNFQVFFSLLYQNCSHCTNYERLYNSCILPRENIEGVVSEQQLKKTSVI